MRVSLTGASFLVYEGAPIAETMCRSGGVGVWGDKPHVQGFLQNVPHARSAVFLVSVPVLPVASLANLFSRMAKNPKGKPVTKWKAQESQHRSNGPTAFANPSLVN